ncbi:MULTISPECIES: phosphate-starvation-inducible PsiE family protein [Terriglobus]|jgi:uncharacterized membrane protein (DUF373 family)|uniref:Phosphate-starvation-inducible E n=2 Tax=Terriglobus TaxID=392733 RepID=A0A1H4W478_9BACT|nr:phosphate-starvation-inducible PsiE family protein [Terriglobus roseus]SEC88055.1 Phosphate-starvation-inducible E [Terriglobus roseus]
MTRTPPTRPSEDNLRVWCCGYLSVAEVAIYVILGVLLCAAAAVGIAGAVHLLWVSIKDWTGTKAVFELIDRLLFVLMLVEILHTVRISIKSHMLVVEPFLIVGLIAIVRRLLVLTLQAEALTSNNSGAQNGAMFHSAMIEMGVLGGLVAVLVTAIYAMRRTRPKAADAELKDIVADTQ